MIKLTEEDHKNIWINPNYIVQVCKNEKGATAVALEYSGDGYWWVNVREPVELVVNLIHDSENK